MSETLPMSAPDAAPNGAALVAALGRRSIVLVGMMGAGKSSIGRRVAARLAIPFVDADAEIELAADMTIAEIFAVHGEPYFRAGEARVIARLLERGPQVLATGGGAFMNAQTRAALKEKAVSVWLKADLDVLTKRLRRRSDRPLLKTDDPVATLDQSSPGARPHLCYGRRHRALARRHARRHRRRDRRRGRRQA